MLNRRRPRAVLAVVSVGLFAAVLRAAGQESKPPTQNAEMATSESTFKLRAERNLVVVRVIVRDRNGQAVTGLRKEDFRLFDDAKPQTIAEFSVEPAAKATPPTPTAPGQPTPAPTPETRRPVVRPDRFVALYFDDVYLPFEDAVYTRNAAKKYLANSLRPGDRAAVFTSSGHLTQDFTADRDKLTQVIDQIQPRPLIFGMSPCQGAVSPYEAHLIVDMEFADAISDGQAVCGINSGNTALTVTLPAAAAAAAASTPTTTITPQSASRAEMAKAKASAEIQIYAHQILELDEVNSRTTLRQLESLVRHMAVMPGQRNIVLVSPGFFSLNLQFELGDIIERALNAHVVINTLDSRGLFTYPGDAGMRGAPNSKHLQFDSEAMLTNGGVLDDLADATGGVYFHDSNDYDGGFLRAGALPGTSYILAFSPSNLKLDGAYHHLKVTLAQRSNFTLQARHGYYAPQKAEDAAAREKDTLEEAVYSLEEIHDLPMDFKTQFYKSDNLNATLTVLAHVDPSSIQFRKEEGRNLDNLTLVAALFDDDGNYVAGNQEKVQLRLKASSVGELNRSGIYLRTKLNARVGNYTLRVVVRDSQSARIAASSEPLEIPY